MYQKAQSKDDAKKWYREYDMKFWKDVRNGIARLDRSTTFGLYPFKVEGFAVIKKANWDAKVGTKTNIYINQETDVQVSYSFTRIRYFDMSDPVESEQYWNQRNAVKAAFFRSMGWRKAEYARP